MVRVSAVPKFYHSTTLNVEKRYDLWSPKSQESIYYPGLNTLNRCGFRLTNSGPMAQAVTFHKDSLYGTKEQALIDLPPCQPSKEPQLCHNT